MDPTAANKETIAKVTVWLDKRKASITPERAVVIQSLIDNLEFSNLHFEELNRGEKFIIVPVSDNFKSQNNKSKKSITNAVFILTETNTIGEGNIVQYIADDVRITKAPNNTFSKIFNSRELDCNGKFSFLKITDEMVYALVYKKGNFFSASSFKKKPQSSSAANSVQQQCYDVYWVTYYDDGRSRWDYMYSYCDDQCNTTKKFNDMATIIACGGGGSEEEEEEVIKGADYEWTVQNIPADFGSGWLRQLNRLVAKFNNRRPERNHFLGGSATSINLYANSWGENGTVGYSNTSTPVTVNSNTQVTVASSGTIRFFINDITYDYSGSKALPLSCCNWQ